MTRKHNGKVIQTATHLTLILAEYLADTIAWLMRSVLDFSPKIPFDNDAELLLTPAFWILPLYRESLNSARRNRPSAASRELGVAQAWKSEFARKTRSRGEKGSFMRIGHTPTTEEDLPSGLGRAA